MGRQEPVTRWAIAAAVVLIAGGVALRLFRLGSVPGVNGDEAWMGVQAVRLLSGEGVAWRTPTGNPLNPFSFVPLIASHALFQPSFAHLRWVAATSGLLLLVVNFALCRMVYGPRTVIVTTVALAVLPITIAYSRFAWDASQTVLFILPVLYLPMAAWRMPHRRGRLLTMAGVGWVAAVLVHPTNVFSAPLLVIPFVALYGDTLRARYSSLTRPARILIWTVVGVVLAVIAVVGRQWWRLAIGRATSFGEASEFLRLVVDLFSGVTVYRYISGTLLAERQLPWGVSDLMTVQIVTAVVVMAIAWGVIRTVASGRDPLDRVLLAGVAACAAGLYLIAGPWALRPHTERYGQCLVAGGVLLAVRGVDWYLGQPRLRGPAAVSLVSLAALSLVGFVGLYWLPLTSATTRPHPAFRTADIEPKQAALTLVHDELGSRRGTIGAGSWWSYWPLAYLAARHPNITVVTDAEFVAAADRRDAECWVELVDTPSYDKRSNEPSTRRTAIADPAGREILSVFCGSTASPGGLRDRVAPAASPP